MLLISTRATMVETTGTAVNNDHDKKKTKTNLGVSSTITDNWRALGGSSSSTERSSSTNAIMSAAQRRKSTAVTINPTPPQAKIHPGFNGGVARQKKNTALAKLRVTATPDKQPKFVVIAPARIFPTAVARNRARRRVMAIIRAEQNRLLLSGRQLPSATYRLTITTAVLTASVNELQQAISDLLK